jgi:hypothetical protein
MPTCAPELTAPSANEVRELAADWYHKLDVHAPLVDLLPLVSKDAVMKFPEATLRGLADFEGWYERVIRIFFDEVHTVKSVQLGAPKGNSAVTVQVVVHWEASVWNPPAHKSQRIKLDAYQTWVVARDEKSERAVITQYTVDKLVYDADSAKL